MSSLRVAWKPTHAPRQHRVQYKARNKLERAAPTATFLPMSGPFFALSRAFLCTSNAGIRYTGRYTGNALQQIHNLQHLMQCKGVRKVLTMRPDDGSEVAYLS